MNAYHNIPLRSARNRLLAIVSSPDTVLSFPIRDLLICYPQNPLSAQEAKVYILGAEADVMYSLQDEKGKIVPDNNSIGESMESDSPDYKAFIEEFKNSVKLERLKDSASLQELQALKNNMDIAGQRWLKVFPEGAAGAAGLTHEEGAEDFIQSLKNIVVLTTPSITRDTSFTILANTQEQNKGRSRAANLISGVDLRPYFQVSLTIKTVSTANVETLVDASSSQIEIDAGDAVHVTIVGGKEQMKYSILDADLPEEAGEITSQEGLNYSGTLVVSDIDNDIMLHIMALRTGTGIDQTEASNRLLLRGLNVLVKINQDVEFDFEPAITSPIIFDTVPKLAITAPQKHVNYTLFRYRLTIPRLDIGTQLLPEPDIVSDAINLNTALDAGILTRIYSFKLDTPTAGFAIPDGPPFASDSNLKEDSVLVVRAEKSNTREATWLNSRLVARTDRPDPGCPVQVDPLPPFLAGGDTVHISIPDAQTGVAYQLKSTTAGASPMTIGPALLTGANRIGWETHNWAFGMRIAEDEASVGRAGNFKVREKIEDIEDVSFDPIAVVFPSHSPAADTQYSIRAIKQFTGLELDLSQVVSVRKGYLQFDGLSARIAAAGYTGITAGQKRTVEAWVRKVQVGPILVWGAADTPGAKWLLHVNDNEKLEMDIQGAQLTGTTILQDGVWHHVCCVLDPPVASGSATLNHVRLYLNGMPEQTEITGAITTIDTGMELDLTVGNDGADIFFAGDMAEIRVWDIAVPEADIQNNMYQRLAGDEAGLVLYWKLNDGQGTVVTNSSDQARAGILEGGMWM